MDEHRFKKEKIHEFMDMIDWDFVKKTEIIPDGEYFIAKLTHYRSGRYMLHSLKYGWKSE